MLVIIIKNYRVYHWNGKFIPVNNNYTKDFMDKSIYWSIRGYISLWTDIVNKLFDFSYNTVCQYCERSNENFHFTCLSLSFIHYCKAHGKKKIVYTRRSCVWLLRAPKLCQTNQCEFLLWGTSSLTNRDAFLLWITSCFYYVCSVFQEISWISLHNLEFCVALIFVLNHNLNWYALYYVEQFSCRHCHIPRSFYQIVGKFVRSQCGYS